MADKKRYRVVGRDYVVFDDVKVPIGKLIPETVEVEEWLLDRGWVEEAS